MKDKALIELIVVLILVGFGLWLMYKDKNSGTIPNPTTDTTVNTEEVTPN